MPRLLVDCPCSVEGLVELGLRLYRQGRLEAAATALRRAVAVAPHLPEPHYDLALVLMDLGDAEAAAAENLLALAARRDYPEAWCNLGNALLALGKLGQAAAAYRQALDWRPDHADSWNNLGLALQDLGLAEPALAAYRRAIAQAPGFASPYHNLGTLLKDRGDAAGALAAYGRAVGADPELLMARAALAHQRRHACDWEGLEAEEARLMEAVRRGGRVAPMILLAMDVTAEDQLTAARNWLAPVEAAAAGQAFGDWPRLTAEPADGRLRIGYLSADFYAHATAYLTAELFERHDRQGFQVLGYSLGPDDGSAMRRRLTAAFDGFVDLRGATHAEAAARIHGDGIDILVDLKGHSQYARPEILALRPAPLQVAWLGYPGTTGAGFIDWAIVDSVVAPATEQPFWSETLLPLPDCYQVNDRRREIAAVPTRQQCGLPEDGFVFCAFNNAFKLGPGFFEIWMRLLRQVPGSVLWLLEAPAPMPHNLRREAARRGVDPGRLVFAPQWPLADHLARHQVADLFLDLLPCGAHTTASDALWAGLPLLTVRGKTFAGRVAASLLTALGVTELIAETPSAYEALALALAADPARLSALRGKITARREASPLFDCPLFARNLERAYRRIWGLRRSGQPKTQKPAGAKSDLAQRIPIH